MTARTENSYALYAVNPAFFDNVLPLCWHLFLNFIIAAKPW
jgi:hypothetical protein